MKLRSNLQWRREGDAPGYLFDPRSGNVHGLNDTAAFLLTRIEAGDGRAALIEAVVAEFDIFPLSARTDVDAFLNILQDHGLVDL
ncbi:MAG: HPr-rel-A system PqqD family peptide chaperone [Planctomycetes bacterium]|jgi:PqqD family protein of HPr-rel-A system|nr:HPr-rel-A system PqqD family peptide chaperone [Planctomycetota bacterium]MBT4029835.1 HPr-rel-A system PqqD family peptide chaperone [Planctomycetota bacterium]MBT4559929.1 HPr-rel-A system PqqD family peptide chaperone [Planctomycetota bacterium]MBT5101041.1 HPr-rel-A system PqqD family peptide chaperone [Planctomycetota bacterium]MBT5119634.1 HPr-rel-A system PqqD family peptide chaperone [Planctomycetota bacterium]